jgi:hypothetical protein
VLNKPAAEKFSEQGATNVLILWDEENRRFAIRPIFKKDSRAYPMRPASGKSTAGATINAKSFLDTIGVDISETKQYPAAWNDQEGLLEVEIPLDRFKARQTSLVRLPTRNKTA